MSMRTIEEILTQLPRTTLRPERDEIIRRAISSMTPSTIGQGKAAFVPTRSPWFAVLRFSVVLTVIVIAVASVGGYAYASPSVTRGDVLYAVKRGMERTVGSWQKTPIAQATFRSTLALRRLSELEVLVRERQRAPEYQALDEEDQPINSTAAEVVTETDAAAYGAAAIADPSSAKQVVAMLTTRQAQMRTRLRQVAKASGIADARTTDAIARTMQAIDEITTATGAAAAEIAIASARGDRTIRVGIANGRTDPEVVDTEDVQDALAEERIELADFQSTLARSGVPSIASDQLIMSVERKLERAARALDVGSTQQAAGLLKSAIAIRKHAKHFVEIAGEDVDQRRAVEDAITVARDGFDSVEAMVEILRDVQVNDRATDNIVALLEAARVKLVEAAASTTTGANEQAQVQVEVAVGLLRRLEERLEAVDHASVEAIGSSGTDDAEEVDTEDTDDVRPMPTGGFLVPAEEMGVDGDGRGGGDGSINWGGRNHSDGDREARRGRVRGQSEEWTTMGAGAASINPETGVRYEFKGEYLRPPAW